MRRLIIGATAIVTGLAAALGVLVRRRRGRRDDVLPLDPAPPLGSNAPASHEPVAAPSIEAGLGPVGDSPAAAKRKPPARRKPATTKRSATGAGKTGAAKADDAPNQAAAPAARPKRPTRVRTSPLAKSAESVEPAAGDGADPADGS